MGRRAILWCPCAIVLARWLKRFCFGYALVTVVAVSLWTLIDAAYAAPRITIISPIIGDVLKEVPYLEIEGQIEDKQGLKSLEIFLNGKSLPHYQSLGISIREIEGVLQQLRDLKGIDVWPLDIRIPSQVLRAGENTLHLVATNLRGEITQDKRIFWYEPTKTNIYVAVIGINNYRDERLSNLKYAEDDANAVADYFRDRMGVEEENLFLLLGRDATVENIKRVLGVELKRKAQKSDQIVIYFAGHGAPEPEATANVDGLEKYLLPWGADIDALYATAIPFREIEYLLGRYTSERVVFLLDTCFSGQAAPGARTLKLSGMRAGVISADFYNRLATGEGRLILAAAGPNQLSWEHDNLRHGVFTYFLLEALDGSADNDRDGIITFTEVYQYVAKHVPAETDQNQTPLFFGTSTHEIVLGWAELQEIVINTPSDLSNMGRLIIEVSPPDSRIYVDGDDQGNGPILNTALKPGSHTVAVKKRDYLSEKRDVVISAGSATELTFTLEKGHSAPPP